MTTVVENPALVVLKADPKHQDAPRRGSNAKVVIVSQDQHGRLTLQDGGCLVRDAVISELKKAVAASESRKPE